MTRYPATIFAGVKKWRARAQPMIPVKFVIGRVSFARMHQYCNGRAWPPRRILARVFVVSLLLLVIFNGPFVAAADRLVLLSPHWKGIEDEFERAFKAHHLRETGRTVELEWLDVGGTSEVLRFIRSEFNNKPGGIGIDVFFGGGLEPYLALKKEQLLRTYALPEELLKNIPPHLGGVPLYDPDYAWYAATLAGFGIVYNKVVLQLANLPIITTWEGLASPAAFGWVGSSDPRKSGSVHAVYEIILQAYGWEKGWRIITGLGANVRNFTNSASQVPKDVAIGEVAYGLAIDFFAWAQVNEAGADKIGFVMPDNLTVIGPDGIAILKGAPNPSVAEAFVRFVMSPAGQKLWLWVKGAADGPRNFQLNRFSVLPSLYGLSPEHTAVKLNPFLLRSDFAFDEKLATARYAIVNDLVGTMVIDPKDLLTQAWRIALAAGLTAEEWQRLGAMPVSEAEALDLAKSKWTDPAFRNQKLNEWSQFAREKYRKNIMPPLVRPEWLSLSALGFIAFGLIVYSRKLKR